MVRYNLWIPPKSTPQITNTPSEIVCNPIFEHSSQTFYVSCRLLPRLLIFSMECLRRLWGNDVRSEFRGRLPCLRGRFRGGRKILSKSVTINSSPKYRQKSSIFSETRRDRGVPHGDYTYLTQAPTYHKDISTFGHNLEEVLGSLWCKQKKMFIVTKRSEYGGL